MKNLTTFVLSLLIVLYQGINTDKMPVFSKLHGEKRKAVGRINKVPMLIGREMESSKSIWKPKWRGGYQMKTNVRLNIFFFRLKRIAQLALQELNLSSLFNFNLALPDIITNKTSGENAMSDKYCFQSYASKHFALIP